MTAAEKIAALRKELREAKKSWSWAENRNIDLLAKIDRLRERLTEAGVNLARAEDEVLLVRQDGWMKVIPRPTAQLPSARPPRDTLPGNIWSERRFILTDHCDAFGRPVYSEK